jgi:glycerol-3-phosphate acyltransferase PlsY
LQPAALLASPGTSFRSTGSGAAARGRHRGRRFAALAPFAILIAGALFLIVFGVGRRVSAGSLAAVAALPVAAYATTGSAGIAAGAGIAAALIIMRHRENIGRLWNGTEPVFALRKKPGNSPHP